MDQFERDSSLGARPANRTRCRQCGTHVSPTFARVFGDNDDVLHSCLECTTAREIWSGDAGHGE